VPSGGAVVIGQGLSLTALERVLIPLLQEESAANGHDFGVLEQVRWTDRRQLGGVITSLQAKGVITEVDKTVVDDQTITQYVLADGWQS
jgi:hypothetical protein